MLKKNERACTTRMGDYVRIKWVTMHENNEGSCTTRMSEYVRME